MSPLLRPLACAALVLNLLSLVGCAAVYVTKGAERLPLEQSAVLSDKFPTFKPWVFVTAVDGVPRPFGSYKSYQLAPGERSVQVMGNSQLYLYGDTVTLTFTAVAGGKYELKYERLAEPHTWRAWIVDESTGQIVSQ
jgi:hypothetical protein